MALLGLIMLGIVAGLLVQSAGNKVIMTLKQPLVTSHEPAKP